MNDLKTHLQSILERLDVIGVETCDNDTSDQIGELAEDLEKLIEELK